ncbi:MAG: ATPase domain-containing protein [Candidatus Caldarchaeales archaeon]
MRKQILIPTGIEDLDDVIKGFPRGGLITLAGNPGTGKSALAATFIYNGALKYGEPGVYASFLEDEERFYNYMMSFGLDLKTLEDNNMFRYLPIPTLLEPGMSISAAEIIETVESIGAKRLVIDSFTAMKQMFKSSSEARVFLQSLLSRVARQLECTTILIKEVSGEGDEFGYEDFISDGVIVLKRKNYEGRLLREMSIVKMRGTEIRNPEMIFSLHKGFKLFKPKSFGSENILRRYEPPPDPEGRYTSGFEDLDREIGGYPRGSVVLHEVDPNLSMYDRLPITSRVYLSYLSKNRPTIWLPSVRISLALLHEIHKWTNIPDEIIDRYLIILSDIGKEGESPSYLQRIELLDPGQFNESLWVLVDKFIRETKTPPMIVLGIDKLAYRFGENILDSLYFVANMTKSLGGLTVWIYEPIYPWIIERVVPLTDFHFKITRLHGRVVFYGVKPLTPLYVVEPVETHSVLKFIPIH